MSELTTCPITLIVTHPHSKDPVRVENVQSVVFRDEFGRYYFTHRRVERITGLEKPLIRRFVIRTHLKADMTGFESRLDARNFFRVFFPEEKVYNYYG